MNKMGCQSMCMSQKVTLCFKWKAMQLDMHVVSDSKENTVVTTVATQAKLEMGCVCDRQHKNHSCIWHIGASRHLSHTC